MTKEHDLLRRALEALDRDCADSWNLDTEIRAFLAAEPEADKPMAWMHPNGGVIQTRLTGLERDTYTIPLYTRPEPARKPMTEEEIKELCPFTRQEFVTGFNSGVRFTEKHHGITED